MFVVVTLAVLMGAVVPRFGRTLERLKAEQMAFQIAQLVRYAQSTAVFRQATVDCELATIKRAESDPGRLVVRLRTGEQPLGDRLASVQVPRGLTIQIVAKDEAPNDQLSFFPNGSSETARIMVNRGEAPGYTIEVDGPTGRSTVVAGTAAR